MQTKALKIKNFKLFFHSEFIDKEDLQSEGKVNSNHDFTIYQKKHFPLDVITQQDFIENRALFLLRLYDLPFYEVEPFIKFHYEKFPGDKMAWLSYVYNEFKSSKTTVGDKEVPPKQKKIMLLEWVSKKIQAMVQKQLEEKNVFLRKAYEVAQQHSRSSPYSVNINPQALGKTLGMDLASVQRILTELLEEGYIKSTLGARSLFVTHLGLKYLEKLAVPVNNSADINLTVGNHSQVMLNVNSPGASIKYNNEVTKITSEIIQTLENDASIDPAKKTEAITFFNNFVTNEQFANDKDVLNTILTYASNISSISSLAISLFQLFNK